MDAPAGACLLRTRNFRDGPVTARKTSQTISTICALLIVILCRSSSFAERAPTAPQGITTRSGVQMVLLPGGTFIVGDKEGEVDEVPHEVTVSPFYVDKYEVTQQEYQRLMGENPSKVKGKTNPVEQVRWSDAVRYCNARSRLAGLAPAYDLKTWTCRFEANGFRLPTEAEWEYAARAGTTTRYSFGNSEARLKQHGWFRDNARSKPHPVGQRKPNAWGLYDVHGNVWEWCNDFYKVDYYVEDPQKDPGGPQSGETKVLRGGCWSSGADACRSAYRYNEAPGYADVCFGYDIYGFRCVRRHEAE